MPRPPKPYLFRDWFVTKLGGQRQKLCRAEEGVEEARKALRRLQIERDDLGGRSFPALTVTELASLFLDTVKVEKSDSTYLNYQRWLIEFARRHGAVQAR